MPSVCRSSPSGATVRYKNHRRSVFKLHNAPHASWLFITPATGQGDTRGAGLSQRCVLPRLHYNIDGHSIRANNSLECTSHDTRQIKHELKLHMPQPNWSYSSHQLTLHF